MPSSRDLVQAFHSRGFQLWEVGGALRDELLLLPPAGDADYATDAPPDDIAAIGEAIGARANLIGQRFGTIGLFAGGRWCEITTFRGGESYPEGSRWPEVTFGTSIEEDLARRDFTINALARNTATGDTLDLFDGRADLEARLIRAVGEPEQRFAEDPLRILRALRFAAQLGFEIEPATLAAVRRCTPLLTSLSQERITAELDRLLIAKDPSRGLDLLRDTGALEAVLPELAAMPGCEQNSFHRFDVWGHTVATVEAIEPGESPRLRRWTALLHDAGKPPVRERKENGEWGFYRHDTVGAELVSALLERLRVGKSFAHDVTLLVRRHMDRPDLASRRSVRRFVSRVGPLWPDLVALKRADNASHTYDDSAYHDDLERLCRSVVEEDAIALQAQSPLTGDDLMRIFDRPQGPWLGEVKQRLSDAVLDGEIEPGDREGAERIAREVVERNPG